MAMPEKFTLLLINLILAVGTNAAAEFRVLHSPLCLKFSGPIKTLESLLKEIISASLGLSVDENTEWKGLYVVDPFSTPEAAVSVYVDGVSSLGNINGTDLKTFPLTIDEYEPKIYEAVKHRIKQRFSNGGNQIVNIQLSDRKEVPLRPPTKPCYVTGYVRRIMFLATKPVTYKELASRHVADVFGDIKIPKVTKQPLVHLKYSVEEDYQFLNELQALKAITAKVSSGTVVPDNIVDFYNFRFTSLHALSDFHGPNSAEIEEAKTLLSSALQELSNAFVKAYYGSVLVTTIVTDVTHSRRVGRSPDDDEPPPPPPAEEPTTATPTTTGGGGGDDFDANFPIIFNIILWFGLVYTFSIVAVVCAMTNMDPGRDSIIYRMTSIRMKKDV